jgi:hypothetical protein
LAQHGVDESGLAVIDVSDDGDIANILIHGRYTKPVPGYLMRH